METSILRSVDFKERDPVAKTWVAVQFERDPDIEGKFDNQNQVVAVNQESFSFLIGRSPIYLTLTPRCMRVTKRKKMVMVFDVNDMLSMQDLIVSIKLNRMRDYTVVGIIGVNQSNWEPQRREVSY
jgi:hypothetical protein